MSKTNIINKDMKTDFFSKTIKESSVWLLFLLPALIIYFLFMAFPLFNSMRLSFYTGAGLTPDHFTGFDNYIELFTNPFWKERFLNALKNTFIFFGINMLIQNTFALLFATLFSTQFKGRNLYRTLIFIPTTLSILVTGFLWKLILNPTWGALNKTLTAVGLEHLALPWLGSPKTALVVITLVSCWQWVGLPTMMFLAGLQAIPEDLFEAARIDGASAWNIFWRVKLPLITPIIGIVTILTLVGNFSAFDIVFAMASSSGAPNYSSDIMGTFFYRTAIAGEHPVAQPNMGLGATVSTVTFLILFISISIWLILSREKDSKIEKGI